MAERKATDIILELESKIDMLISLNQSLDLNIKLLSNKLNLLNDKIEKIQTINNSTSNMQMPPIGSKIITETDPLPLMKDFRIEVSSGAVDTRRMSRTPQLEVQEYINAKSDSDLLWDPNRKNNVKASSPPPAPSSKTLIGNIPEMFESPAKVETPDGEFINNSNSKIPVVQRVLSKKNKKAVFLADIEIKDLQDHLIYKTKTNGAGKWEASIYPGRYRVFVRKTSKNESNSIDRIEIVQDIIINVSNNIQNLEDLMI